MFPLGSIIFNKKQKAYYEVCNNPYFEGGLLQHIYALKDIKTGEVLYINREKVEYNCTLCKDNKNLRILYGRS